MFNTLDVALPWSTTKSRQTFSTEQPKSFGREQEISVAEQDRRVRRTRMLLHEAFIALVEDKGYERTTIQDILDRADVGRSTFYAHYRDKEALLIACFDEMGVQLRREIDEAILADPIDVSWPAALIFEHAYRNQRVYRALCSRQGGTLVQRHLHGVMGEWLGEHLQRQFAQSNTRMPAEVAAEFYTAAALGLLTWWINQDFCQDHAWLTELYRKLACSCAHNS
jgi:AcrR family transcriptional regulator